MHSFEVKAGKNILDIDVLPNRAHDCFSHLGIAREISALLKIPLKAEPLPKLKILRRKAEEFLKLEVREPALCRRYLAAIMINVKVGSSPSWLRERLVAAGQKSINNIVDAGNYVMMEVGQPLHAFDMDKINPVKIVVRKARTGEEITTLDNRHYKLNEETLVIADSKMPLAIAGIKGGKKAEIDNKTKNIVIESANFEPTNIRFTSKKLGLRTGASAGFENEISPNLASIAMERVLSLIQKTAGGEIIAGKIDYYPEKIPLSRVSFKTSDVSKLLGVDIPEKEIISVLKRLGFGIQKTKGTFIIISPLERLDINIKEDVIEEIARIYGYEKIPSRVPEGLLIPARRNNDYFYENAIRDILVGAGFSEVYNYSFSSSGEIEIENPIAIDKKYLRANLLDGLKDNAGRNLKYFDEIRIFEMGKIFRKLSGAEISEKNALAGIVAYKNPKKEGGQEFSEVKGILEMLFSRLGMSDFWFDDSPKTEAVKADRLLKLAEIKIGNTGIGFVDKNAFEIDLEKFIGLATEEIEYRPVSKYPAVIRDVAVLVPLKTKVIEVLDVIENTAGKLLIDTDLFDIYEGEELGKGRKNFAFHLIFQSGEKTLSDKEINILMEKIIKAIEEKSDWEVRK